MTTQPPPAPVAWLYHDQHGSLKLALTIPPPPGSFPVYASPTPAPQSVEELTLTLLAMERLQEAYNHATPGKWRKGQTTHHTVTDRPHAKGYKIGEFHHASDAEFCDVAHELVPLLLSKLREAAQRLAGQAVPTGQAEPADERRVAALESALAECRDAFQIPAPHESRDRAWQQAIGEPLSVPGYVRESIEALIAFPVAVPAQPPQPEPTCSHPEIIAHTGNCVDCGQPVEAPAQPPQPETRIVEEIKADLARVTAFIEKQEEVEGELPPLPKPRWGTNKADEELFTATQMHAYARAAQQTAPSDALTAEQIEEAAREDAGGVALDWTLEHNLFATAPQRAAFRRGARFAIAALRAQEGRTP